MTPSSENPKRIEVHFPDCSCEFCTETLEDQIRRERNEAQIQLKSEAEGWLVEGGGGWERTVSARRIIRELLAEQHRLEAENRSLRRTLDDYIAYRKLALLRESEANELRAQLAAERQRRAPVEQDKPDDPDMMDALIDKFDGY